MPVPRKEYFVKQYLFFYLLSLIMPIIMGIITYIITYNLEYKRVETENTTFLTNGMDKLNETLLDAANLSIQLLTDEDVTTLSEISDLFSSDKIYKAIGFLNNNTLIPKSLLNEFFSNYFIIEESLGYVFSHDTTSPIKSFYTYNYRVESFNFKDFLKILSEMENSGFYPEYSVVSVGNSEKHYFPYFHVYKKSNGLKQIIMVLIDSSSITSLFRPIINQTLKSSIRLEYNGNTLVNEIDKKFLKGADQDVERVMLRKGANYISVASYQNWKCYLLQPVGILAEHIQYIPKLVLFMILGILFIGFLFMLILAYKSSRPVINLLEKIRQDKDESMFDKDILNTLEFFFEQMKGRNNRLEELISEQKTKLKTNFLISLLYDTIPNPSQIPTLARHAGVKMGEDSFITIVLHLKSQESSLGDEWEHLFPISLVSLQSQIFQIYGSRVHIIQINLNQICLLANFSESSKSWKKDRLVQIFTDWVKADLQETFVIGISQYHNGWQEVPRSFREARAALIYNWPNNDNSINEFQEKSGNNSDGEVYFPNEMDHVILDSIRSGSTNDLKECLNRIRRENLELRKLEPFAQNILIANYQKIISNALTNLEIGKLSMEEKLNKLIHSNPDNLSDFLYRTEETLLELCDYFYSNQEIKEMEIACNIKNYLEHNFQNNQLSLIMTAESHGLSNQYLSRLIKKYYGKTFRNFMEDIRMEYVRKLIMESDKPINTLIDKGGYNSMNTFCKAFKRKYGYNASSMRE